MDHQFGAHANRFLGGSSKIWSSFGRVGLLGMQRDSLAAGRVWQGGGRGRAVGSKQERGGVSERELWKIYMLKQPN